MCKETRCFFFWSVVTPQTSIPCLNPQNPSHPPFGWICVITFDLGIKVCTCLLERRSSTTPLLSRSPKGCWGWCSCIERKVDMSIKGGVVYMLKDIRWRCWIFDLQTTLTCLHLLTISQMRMARDQRLSASWRKEIILLSTHRVSHCPKNMKPSWPSY